jgi:hypothetical protein
MVACTVTHPLPAAVQALLAASRALNRQRVLAGRAAPPFIADGRSAPAVARGLDQESARVRGSRLGDRAGRRCSPLERSDETTRQKLMNCSAVLKPPEVCGRADPTDRGQLLDPAHAPQPSDLSGVRPIDPQLADRALQLLDAPVDLVDGQQLVVKGRLLTDPRAGLAAHHARRVGPQHWVGIHRSSRNRNFPRR